MTLGTTLDRGGAASALEVVGLGGLNEFGLNALAVSWADTTILIDAGVMFPDPDLPGVDRVIPDLSYLERDGRKIAALVLTHGHEDHLGAVPHVFPGFDGPVFGTPFTLGLLAPKLEEHGLAAGDRLVAVQPRTTVQVGPFGVEFIRVTHSMPDCVALAVHTPVGTVVHSGDFKIDHTPIDGHQFDLHRFAELGTAGVLALFADSTNIERPGVTGSELTVVDAFEEIFAGTRGKLVVTAFATSIYRIQILVDLAARFGRRVAFVGRGMVDNTQTAERLGYLRVPPGLIVRESEVRHLAPSEVLCLTTGSQGEPLAALSRIAVADHRHISVGAGDRLVFSARVIPGHEKAVDRVVNHLTRRGCEVIGPGDKRVHVSGHGSEEELKLLLSLVRPRVFVPVHGEFRQRSRYARLATQMTEAWELRTQVILAENGEVLRLTPSGADLAGRVPAGRVLIDGAGLGEVDEEVLRDRRHLAEDGLVVPVLMINTQTGAIEGNPEIITRGLVLEPGGEDLLREAVRAISEVVDATSIEERTDSGLLKEKVRVELRRLFRKRVARRPLVLPVIMEF